MSEGREWALRVVVSGQDDDGEQPGVVLEDLNLVDEKHVLAWEKVEERKVLESRVVVLIYSSGTTGLPKGVKLSHRNLVSQTVTTGDMVKTWVKEKRPDFEYRTLARTSHQLLPLSHMNFSSIPINTFILLHLDLPTAHIAGIQGYLINPFYLGGTVYWTPRFTFPSFLHYNFLHRITFFFTVPPIYLLIAKSPLVTTQFRTLELAISGAAPLGKELQYAASQKLGGMEGRECFIDQTWGLSETTGSVTIMPTGMHDDTGSVSSLIPNMCARLVDDAGHDVEPGEAGEVLVKGPVVCSGYYRNVDADKEAFTHDGWFRTGDVAVCRNGLFYVVDRKKEIIKYKGLQVAPAELEALLLEHPCVADAAVIGVASEDGVNEVPRAYVVVVGDGEGVGKEEIMVFVEERVAPHKRLRGGVVFLEEIPKSPSGKILRKDLRVLAARERGARL
jgi:acyl-CoA synthetase (AMP-forming)/AMP-acid ligase II